MYRTFSYILVIYVIIVVYCNCDVLPLSSLNSTDTTINVTEDGTTEIHHTTCKITSERLVANAQATFTRVLTGACNAKTIDERFDKLESSINERLDEIRGMIFNVIAKKWNLPEDSGKKGIFGVNDDSANLYENEFDGSEINSTPRRDEIERYNNSIREISTNRDQEKVYAYYWRVANIGEKLSQWKTGRSERSSTFYVGDEGYAMYLKFTPKYFPDGTIFVSVGITKGSHDSNLIWPFPLQIQIEILDLEATADPDDRSSRLWDPATVCSADFWGRPGIFGNSDNPECVGLSIPRNLLVDETTGFSQSFNELTFFNRKYVSKDSLIVKLSVHLLMK